MNKKGLSNLMLVIIGFAFISVTYFFVSLFLFHSGADYLITPISTIGQDIINNNTVSSVNATVSSTINEVENNYLNFNLPFDMFFLVMWISVFSTTVWLSFKANKEGIFNFFGYIFIGTLIMLLITSYVGDFVSWFLTEVFNKLFSNNLISMPLFTFYLNNLGVINFFWWIILVLVNIIDRTMISKTGEVEE